MVFVEWMIDSYLDEFDAPNDDNDPYIRSFGKFKLEFEREVLQLLDEYGLKVKRVHALGYLGKV